MNAIDCGTRVNPCEIGERERERDISMWGRIKNPLITVTLGFPCSIEISEKTISEVPIVEEMKVFGGGLV